MIPAAASHIAAPLRVFITNEGTHSAEHWAIVTARMLVSAGPNISPARLDAARALRAKIVGILTGAFQCVKATSSAAQIAGTATSATAAILNASDGSPWEMEFHAAAIASMIEDVVVRNLATHADIALRTE